jgi:excinuclease ABC subunit B
MMLVLEVGTKIRRQDVLRKLVEIQYKRNDVDFHRGPLEFEEIVSKSFLPMKKSGRFGSNSLAMKLRPSLK